MTDTPTGAQRTPPMQGRSLAGIVLILIGGLFLAERYLPDFDLSDYWPVLLIAAGVAILLRARSF